MKSNQSTKKNQIKRVKTAFVICPLGKVGSETRRRSDQILEHLIEPTTTQLGYKVHRVDKDAEPGIITNRIIENVLRDSVVIADLTDFNANVFYELALRHVSGKPYIQLMEKDQKPPFDTAQTRVIFVDHKDLDSVKEAKSELEKQLRAVEKHPKRFSDSPFSIAVNIQKMKKSGKPMEQNIAELRDIAYSNSARLQQLNDRISDLTPEGFWGAKADKGLAASRIKSLVRTISPEKSLEEDFANLFQLLFIDQVRDTYRDNFDFTLKIEKKDFKEKGISLAQICAQAEYKVHNVTDHPIVYNIPFMWNTYSFEKYDIPLAEHCKIEKILLTKRDNTHIDVGADFKSYEVIPKARPPLKVETVLPPPSAEIEPFGTATIYIKFRYLARLIDGHTQRMVNLTRNVKLRVDFAEDAFFVDIDDFCLPKKAIINPGHEFEWNGWLLPRHGFVVEWRPIEINGIVSLARTLPIEVNSTNIK